MSVSERRWKKTHLQGCLEIPDSSVVSPLSTKTISLDSLFQWLTAPGAKTFSRGEVFTLDFISPSDHWTLRGRRSPLGHPKKTVGNLTVLDDISTKSHPPK